MINGGIIYRNVRKGTFVCLEVIQYALRQMNITSQN